MKSKEKLQTSVLIIDDAKKLAGLISRILELEGFMVFQAYSGKSGLKLVATEVQDGTIGLQSALGEGSRFYFKLPWVK